MTYFRSTTKSYSLFFILVFEKQPVAHVQIAVEWIKNRKNTLMVVTIIIGSYNIKAYIANCKKTTRVQDLKKSILVKYCLRFLIKNLQYYTKLSLPQITLPHNTKHKLYARIYFENTSEMYFSTLNRMMISPRIYVIIIIGLMF